MTMQLAKRMSAVKASEIREILKVTMRPEVISFAGGLPAPELFPTAELSRLAAKLIAERGARALQYSTTEGDPALRAAIAERSNRKWGTALNPDEIMITTGSQQGLDLVGKLFLDEGDVVLCESPTYLGAISAWNVFRPRWVEVATDDEGMIPEALERALATTERVKLVYGIPNFQNPTGRSWSLVRRQQVLEILARHDVPFIDDNPYGEVRFEGHHLPGMQALVEAAGPVLTLGTFSKVLCPGLRIAWIAGPRALLEKLVILKQGADLHTSTLDQMLVAAYLEAEDLEANLAKINAAYRIRRDAMLGALEREMPAGVSWTRPQGGLFLWLVFPEGVDARALLKASLAHDVAFVPGGAFFPNGGHENTARLNFSNMPPHLIEEGIRRLARSLGGAARRAPAIEASSAAVC
ncbi:MAG: PLP-dependent aminotransferase family protein [Deltaproteobacteria bacterium]|nr:PLP-dependent aminotransferase family protein [Deltaproteobacteria bacterium]